MKTIVTGLLIGAASIATGAAQLTVTSLDRTGRLSWMNRICTSMPAYEVLQADSPSGNWRHLAYVTNETSFVIPGFWSGASFYKLAWVGHAPIVFDYVFDEGYGVPAVIGRFNLTLYNPASQGEWVFAPTELIIDEVHPLGTGRLVAHFNGDMLQVDLTPLIGDDGYYLQGRLLITQDSSGCVFTSYSGVAMQNTIAGGQEIGTFIASKAP